MTYTMFRKLRYSDILFFSPAKNSLPGYIRIVFWVVRFFRQVGVSLRLFLNGNSIVSEYRLNKLSVHADPCGVLLIWAIPKTCL